MVTRRHDRYRVRLGFIADDDLRRPLRELAGRGLRQCGYVVLDAGCPTEALLVAKCIREQSTCC